MRISGSNAGYTMFRGSVKGTGYPLHSPFSPFTSPPVRHPVPSHFSWSLPACVRVRVQCRQIQVPTPIPNVGADLPAACRQVGIVGWRPVIGADCRPVAIMELTSEDAALLLIASENVHLKLKREREKRGS